MKISDTQWLEFIAEADTYNGPLTIGELFCKQFEIKDAELINADHDSVWQIIVNKYR
jgi:hypothetical protein